MDYPYGNILPDSEIEKLADDKHVGTVERESGADLHVGSSSLDVHIAPEKVAIAGGTKMGVKTTVDISDESTHPPEHKVDGLAKIAVEPGEFCLARTDEHFDLPSEVMALMHGRSSIGRLGLFVENAGLVDRGFSGTLTLELFNPTENVIEVPAHSRVAQLAFFHQGGSPDGAYDGKYQGQVDATKSRAYQDKEHQ